MFSPSTYVRNSPLSATAVSSSSGNTSNGGKGPRNSATSRVFTGSTLRGLFLFFPCTDSFVLSRWPLVLTNRKEGVWQSALMSSTTRGAGLLDHKTNSADVLFVGNSDRKST